MHLSQDIKPISYLKAKTADVINSVNENQRTIIITQKIEDTIYPKLELRTSKGLRIVKKNV